MVLADIISCAYTEDTKREDTKREDTERENFKDKMMFSRLGIQS